MKVWVLTLTHLDIELLRESMNMYQATTKPIHFRHVLLDHHWPIQYWKHRHDVLMLAEIHRCKVMSPYENLGAHGGYNWMLQNLPLGDDDLVITYDGDSMPQTPYWDDLMMRAMGDPSYAAVSLTIDSRLDTKDWIIDYTSTGVEVKRPAVGIEMINVTMYRWSFLKAVGLFQGPRQFYGLVEGDLFTKMFAMGKKHGYLIGAVERLRPFEPHAEYQAWKAAHVSCQYPGNFSDWAAEKGLQ